MREEWPERGELVVCTAEALRPFGVFVRLEEYEGKEGLIHISEVTTGWVRHLRDYVREGQKVVCKVLQVDAQRGHIDLSLKKVKEGQKKERITEWKQDKKAEKWLSLALSDTAPSSTEEFKRIEAKLSEAYGSLYNAFEEVVKTGKEALTCLGVAEEYAEAVHEVAVANMRLPSVQILGFLELTCPLPDGVEKIKEALRAAEGVKGAKKEAELECLYLGAPKYKMRVVASDYKTAESVLSAASEAALEVIKKNSGWGRFYRKTFS